MDLPAFTDLTALASELSNGGKHGALKRTLMQAWRAQSCLGDLRQAQYCCDALRKRMSKAGGSVSQDDHIVEKSLLTTSLLLYSRATHTSGKGEERGAITLERGHLTRQQWDDHKELVDVRNQAVAHVNPEHKTGTRVWHRLLLFAIRLPNGMWKAASSTNETSFHLETFERLERMLPIARAHVLKQMNRRLTAVTEQINEAGVSDRLLHEKAFDPVVAFGSMAAVQRLLLGSQQQEDDFWQND